MATKQQVLEAVIELALEMDKTDPTDFGYSQFSEESAYRFVATKIIEDMATFESNSARELMLLATATHLTVENFVLHQKALRAKK
jgi:hypothetical protein